MDQLVSIIVPVYKVEDYLPACIDSIRAQTHPQLQIILVDDGSPDDCGTICDRYAASDPRITVIHKANGGLSDARNAGMAVATGSFLMFVDSDDLLPADAVETLLGLALTQDAQLVIGGHARFEDVPHAPTDAGSNFRCLSSTQAMTDMFHNGCAAWARIYRREIHHGISYPVGRINEDEAIVLRILDRCTTVVKTDKIVYHYRCRPESITTSHFSTKKLAWMEHCRDNLAYIRTHHPELEPDAACRYRGSLLWSMTEIALSEDDLTEDIRYMKQQLRKERGLFRRLPFAFAGDRLRLFLLTDLPFCVYKAFIRLKRGVS